MDLIFEPQFKEDLSFWKKQDPKILKRIFSLIEDIQSNPTSLNGLGKPEHLKFWRKNAWSRRITREHRLVYFIQLDTIHFLQCRFHYQS